MRFHSTVLVSVGALAWTSNIAAQDLGARPCQGSGGGGGMLNDRFDVVWSLSYNGERTAIEALAIVKRDAPHSGLALPNRPPPPFPPGGTGANVDTLLIMHDRALKRIWVHTVPVQLGRNNVLLVHRNDRNGGTPEVVQALRVVREFNLAGTMCDPAAFESLVPSLLKHLERVPALRAFLRTG